MPRREYVGNAAATTINGAITAGSTEIQITSATNWPTGSVGPFVVILDRGLAAEEKVLITSRTGTTLFVNTRGFDSTTAASHSNGATIEHGLSAKDIDEVNDHVFDTSNDDHTQYLNAARHDVEARHTFGAALGTAATPAAVARTAATGSGANPSREDHVHNESARVGVILRRAATQSIPDAAVTNISWDTEDQDTDGFIAVPSTTVTVPAGLGGLYAISVNVDYASPSTTRMFVDIVAAGRIWRSDIEAGVEDQGSVGIVVALAAAETVLVQTFQDSAGAINATARFEMFRIGA